MRYQFSLITLLIFSFLPVVIPSVNGQTIKGDPESVYDSIRVIAYDGRLAEAELLARELVDENWGYGDAVVLLARIIAWQERYDEALGILDSLLIEQPQHEDGIEAKNQIMEWKTRAEVAGLVMADSAAIVSPVEKVIAVEPVAAEAETNSDTTARGVDFHLGYSFDTFKEPYKRYWQIFSIGALYRTGAGPLMGTVNFGNIHAESSGNIVETGIQVQAEMWPKISERSYAWLAYAYSPFAYFPRHRASAEYWYNLEKGWVVSAGASYYYFDMHIFIPTFSLEKYAGKYWFSGKTYIHLKDAGTTASVFLTARRYSNDFNYLQLTVGAGTAPDEPYDIATDLERQSAVAIKMTVNRRLNSNMSLMAGAGYSLEEYRDGLTRNRFEGFITLIYSQSKK